MIHTSYADYVACLYQFNGGVVARLTAAGTTFEIKKIIFGLLEEQPACALIHLCAQKALNHNIAIFPYPSLNQPEEVWVFEATPAAAYYLFKAKKTCRKETSEKNYAKILAFLKTALKIQGSRPELEKAILDIKQVLFYLQIEDRARLYLSSDVEVEMLLKSINLETAVKPLRTSKKQRIPL